MDGYHDPFGQCWPGGDPRNPRGQADGPVRQ